MQDRDPSLHSGHRERMKKQFREISFTDFNDHQKLEFLLFYTLPRGDTNELAHKLLAECGGTFSNVCDTPYETLIGIKGIGSHSATLISSIPDISSYYLSSKKLIDNDYTFEALEVVCDYFEGVFAHTNSEEVRAAAITGDYRLIREKKIADGSISSVAVDPRSLMSFAMESHADHIIIAHNHPGSSALASRQDISITRELLSYFEPFRISIDDHIIVGNNGSLSMRSSLSAGSIWRGREGHGYRE